jgi:hypothetical protein
VRSCYIGRSSKISTAHFPSPSDRNGRPSVSAFAQDRQRRYDAGTGQQRLRLTSGVAGHQAVTPFVIAAPSAASSSLATVGDDRVGQRVHVDRRRGRARDRVLKRALDALTVDQRPGVVRVERGVT